MAILNEKRVQAHNRNKKSGGVDDAALAKQTANLRKFLYPYALNDIYNAD